MTTAGSENPYRVIPVVVDKIVVENDARDLKTFRLVFFDPADAFRPCCGQFAMLCVPGAGDSPIGIASSPLDDGYLAFTVKRYETGVVTTELHNLEEGARMGVRGPYGNGFPVEALEGKNIVIVGGGFAFTTLRATIRYMLHESIRAKYGTITVIYGARSPGELLYKDELRDWGARDDVAVHVTVDKGDKTWKGREGFVPTVVQEVSPNPDNAVALVCGPPIMLKYTMPPLLEMGFAAEDIYTSLERKMSCGFGKCGRCDIGGKTVCKDGPVFTLAQVRELTEGMM